MRHLVTAATIALCAATQSAPAQTGNASFCLQTPAGARCSYTTMADCERARGEAPATQCITQADARGATGLGEPAAGSGAGITTQGR